MDNNILDQETASTEEVPLYYSSKAVLWFSVFLSSLFGGILMAINLKGKEGQLQVLLFGVGYLVFVGFLGAYFDLSTNLSLPFGFVGGYVLNTVLWNKYIGKDTVYVSRSITVPLIIALIIFVVIIAALFMIPMEPR